MSNRIDVIGQNGNDGLHYEEVKKHMMDHPEEYNGEKSMNTEAVEVDKVLEERGSRYGRFEDHAFITQALKSCLFSDDEKTARLSASQRESLEMICHKMGRIINGDPDYSDSWIDIAGYAKLVADELEGVSR